MSGIIGLIFCHFLDINYLLNMLINVFICSFYEVKERGRSSFLNFFSSTTSSRLDLL